MSNESTYDPSAYPLDEDMIYSEEEQMNIKKKPKQVKTRSRLIAEKASEPVTKGLRSLATKDFGGETLIRKAAGVDYKPQRPLTKPRRQPPRRPPQTPIPINQAPDIPDIESFESLPQYPPKEYTYKSAYYGRKGYLYMPSVQKPPKHMPFKPKPVNPFRRAKEQYKRRNRR